MFKGFILGIIFTVLAAAAVGSAALGCRGIGARDERLQQRA